MAIRAPRTQCTSDPAPPNERAPSQETLASEDNGCPACGKCKRQGHRVSAIAEQTFGDKLIRIIESSDVSAFPFSCLAPALAIIKSGNNGIAPNVFTDQGKN